MGHLTIGYETRRPWTRVIDLRRAGVPVKRPVDLGEADPRSHVGLAARRRKQILNGDLEPGRPVRSITTLSQEFGHTGPTCGKAMRLLEQEGFADPRTRARLLRHEEPGRRQRMGSAHIVRSQTIAVLARAGSLLSRSFDDDAREPDAADK